MSQQGSILLHTISRQERMNTLKWAKKYLPQEHKRWALLHRRNIPHIISMASLYTGNIYQKEKEYFTTIFYMRCFIYANL